MPSECSEKKVKKMDSSKIKDEIMSKSKSKKNITKSCKDLMLIAEQNNARKDENGQKLIKSSK